MTLQRSRTATTIVGGLIGVAAASAAFAQSTSSLGPVEPRPGHYRVRALHSGFCVGVSLPAGFPSGYFDYTLKLNTMRCDPERFPPIVAVIPHLTGGYTLRDTEDPLGHGDQGRLRLCATVARGVVLGPNSIDMLRCGVPNNATRWCEAGMADQRFTFRLVGENLYEIRTSRNECLDVRDGGTGTRVEVIQWQCHGNANQRFELEYVGPLAAGERACVTALGWRDAPDGLRQARIARGVNLYGNDYHSRPTADDGGAQCAEACIADARCKAFSWVRPGVQGPAAMCWLKDPAPPASANPDVASGIVRR